MTKVINSASVATALNNGKFLNASKQTKALMPHSPKITGLQSDLLEIGVGKRAIPKDKNLVAVVYRSVKKSVKHLVDKNIIPAKVVEKLKNLGKSLANKKILPTKLEVQLKNFFKNPKAMALATGAAALASIIAIAKNHAGKEPEAE